MGSQHLQQSRLLVPEEKVEVEPQRTRSALWAAVGAMVGLRRRVDFERDAAELRPRQLILIALALITMFVGGVITIVHFVLR